MQRAFTLETLFAAMQPMWGADANACITHRRGELHGAGGGVGAGGTARSGLGEAAEKGEFPVGKDRGMGGYGVKELGLGGNSGSRF